MVVPARVNYIRHLNIFFQKVRTDDRLHANHISLYMALFQLWNQYRFQNPFPIIREDVLRLCRIGSYNTYTRCLKSLHAFGYIIYQPAKQRGLPSKISISYLVTGGSGITAQQLLLFDDQCSSRKSEPAYSDFEGWVIAKIATDSSRQFETGPVSILHPFINKQINYLNKERGKPPSQNKKKRSSEKPDKRKISPRAPILTEVQDFFNASGYPPAEALLFFHHYQANGWKQAGKTPIEDWHAQAHKWILNTPNKNSLHNDKRTSRSELKPGGLHTEEDKSYSDPL